MGYYEIRCVLCGVTFSIARLRTRAEPRSHAWNVGGFGYCEHREEPDAACEEGCTFVDREQDVDKFLPSEPSERTYQDTWPEIHEEHISGIRCGNNYGYNGNLVSASAVQCARTAQCILRKIHAKDHHDTADPEASTWRPASDDEPWEESSEWMLSGLNSLLVEREMGPTPGWFPPRHGVEKIFEDDIFWDGGTNDGMPFHPWCLVVYQRAALQQKQPKTIDDMGDWWEHTEGMMEHEKELQRCMGLKESNGNYWEHQKGQEFFIADPLNDPELVKLLRDAVVEPSEDFNPADSAFPAWPTSYARASTIKSGAPTDPFLTLPAELLQQILGGLPTSTIAALREVSRAFAHIPISFFHTLLRQDYPWIWEADPKTPVAEYSHWTQAVTDKAALKLSNDTLQLAGQADSSAVSQQENTTATDQSRTAIIDATNATYNDTTPPSAAHRSDQAHIVPVLLPRFRTNWFKLYVALKKRGTEVPGLKNRERIWRDCEEIMRKIDEMRRRASISSLVV
ncbi:unnamed protein product [Zymoseptoria tritici ST99CH_3D1]|nr:unnamed protein product [Zymoseptoria tritici ST99CH_3D1]